jgi:hypothetical protein
MSSIYSRIGWIFRGAHKNYSLVDSYHLQQSRGTVFLMPTLGQFNLTWPPLLQKASTQFSFVPGQNSSHRSAFWYSPGAIVAVVGPTKFRNIGPDICRV